MADRTLTINHADGGSETYTINRDKFAGVREMVIDGANVSVDRTAVPKEQSKETTFGGSQSITVNRDIEPLLSKVVGGAAAAYSLRDLNDSQGNNNVVRVRRESDNSEKDFKAKEVSNGTMTRWVNAQVIPPLDIGTEVNGVRVHVKDGGTSIGTPAAAYSLRNLSSSGTDVTTSGDTAGDTTGKYVVQVRRSSDDAVKSFTASEVADGTLEAWVNADVVTYESDFSAGVDGWVHNIGTPALTVSSVSSELNLTATANTPFQLARSPSVITQGQSYAITFEAFVESGSGLSYWGGGAYGSKETIGNNIPITEGVWQSVTFSFLPQSGGTLISTFTTIDGDITSNILNGKTVKLRNVQVTQTTADGHVRTWYDQSGSDNHAVQTTAANQPKIVEGGNLLESNNMPEVRFDGTDNYLDLTTNLTAQLYSTFSVYSATQNISYIYSDSLLPAAGRRSTGEYLLSHGTSIGGGVHPSTEILGTYFANGASSEIFSNGTSVVSGDAGNTDNTIRYVFGRPANAFCGTAKELIIYESDQSDNRTAIEANIGETYGITDIPAANDTVDGFVQTWYDQSGNGNDAVQTTATKQPKIVGEVTSGQPHAFLGALVFDQANATELVVVGDPVITADYTGTYSAFSIQTVSNSEFGYLYGNASLGRGSSLYSNGNVYSATNKSSASGFDKISKTSEKDLLSAVYNNGDAGLLVNGGGTMNDQGTYDFASGGGNFKIGNRNGGTSGGTYLTGSIEEIIVYNSDQSSNRPAIETNIANQYGITLS